MRIALTSTLALAGLLVAPQAIAQNTEQDCPPSLDGEAVACLPSNHADLYQIGDIIEEDFSTLEDAASYNLSADRMYYQVGDYVYRVDETGRVIDIVGTIASGS